MPRISFGSFALDTPDGWGVSTVIISGPVDNNLGSGLITAKASLPFRQNLVCQREQVDALETPESYVKKQREGLRRAEISRQDTAPPETIRFKNGREGLLTEQKVTGPDGRVVRQIQLVSIRDGVAYLLIGSHLDGPGFEVARDNFKSMLLSFE